MYIYSQIIFFFLYFASIVTLHAVSEQHGGITTAKVITGPGPQLKLTPGTQN